MKTKAVEVEVQEVGQEEVKEVKTKQVSKRTHALLELLNSERAYASDLALIRDVHIPLALGEFSSDFFLLFPPFFLFLFLSFTRFHFHWRSSFAVCRARRRFATFRGVGGRASGVCVRALH